jgi:hypothetical protein
MQNPWFNPPIAWQIASALSPRFRTREVPASDRFALTSSRVLIFHQLQSADVEIIFQHPSRLEWLSPTPQNVISMILHII